MFEDKPDFSIRLKFSKQLSEHILTALYLNACWRAPSLGSVFLASSQSSWLKDESQSSRNWTRGPDLWDKSSAPYQMKSMTEWASYRPSSKTAQYLCSILQVCFCIKASAEPALKECIAKTCLEDISSGWLRSFYFYIDWLWYSMIKATTKSKACICSVRRCGMNCSGHKLKIFQQFVWEFTNTHSQAHSTHVCSQCMHLYC